MQNQMIVGSLVTFLHNLFTITWIGGLVIFGMVIIPIVKNNPESMQLLNKIQKRQSKFVMVSLLGLLITGVMMSNLSAEFQGLFKFGNPYQITLSVKLILTVLMIVITILRSRRIGPRNKKPSPEQKKMSMILMYINMTFGIIILYLSSLLTVL